VWAWGTTNNPRRKARIQKQTDVAAVQARSPSQPQRQGKGGGKGKGKGKAKNKGKQLTPSPVQTDPISSFLPALTRAPHLGTLPSPTRSGQNGGFRLNSLHRVVEREEVTTQEDVAHNKASGDKVTVGMREVQTHGDDD